MSSATQPGTASEPPPPPPVVDWHLARVIRPADYPDCDYALVILNQPIDNEPLFDELWGRASERVAADGGANRILQLSKRKQKQNHSSSLKSVLPLSSQDGGDNSQQQQQPSWYQDLDTIIGDLDSLSPEARDFFSSSLPAHSKDGRSDATSTTSTTITTTSTAQRKCQIIHDPDQYSTDFTKAVRHVRRNNNNSNNNAKPTTTTTTTSTPRDIICLGGLGGRVDQGLSQLHHLYLFQQDEGSYERDGRIFLLSGEGLTFLLQGGGKRHRIHVRDHISQQQKPQQQRQQQEQETAGSPPKHAFAKHVGILPLREPSVISTRGLEWDVTDWRTEFGGQLSTSNHVVADVVEVQTSKDVLFTIALRREERWDEQP